MSKNTPEEVMNKEEITLENPEVQTEASEEKETKKKSRFSKKKKTEKKPPKEETEEEKKERLEKEEKKKKAKPKDIKMNISKVFFAFCWVFSSGCGSNSA